MSANPGDRGAMTQWTPEILCFPDRASAQSTVQDSIAGENRLFLYG
jgi:hypothetical protein